MNKIKMIRNISALLILGLGVPAFALQQPRTLIPLHEAAKRGDLERVRELIKAGANVNQKDDFIGVTPLMRAIDNGHNLVAQELIKAQANVNLQNKLGKTALTLAAMYGNLSIIQDLLKAGADPNIRTSLGNTPFMAASDEGQPHVVRWFIKQGVDVNETNKFGNTALILAAANKSTKEALAVLDQDTWDNYQKTIEALLTDISDVDAAHIIKKFAASVLSIRRSKPELPKDIRKIIEHQIINDLVDERMQRAHKMLTTKASGKTALDKWQTEDDVAALLDPNNQKGQQRLRALIKTNIMQILPLPREHTVIEEDPFGTWDER